MPGSPPWRSGQVVAGGVRLHYVEAGEPDAPLVVLLHGFPETWYSWRHQIGPLARAGYHVVAPDMRGYGASEKPPGAVAYVVSRLAADVAGLVAALGAGTPALAVAGHDWGGGVTWAFGALHPEQAQSVVVVNCPPASALLHALQRAPRDPRQLLRSWYIAFFQLPLLPELVLHAGGLRFVDLALAPARRRNPRSVTEADVAHARAEMALAGALSSAINYYRALPREAADVRRRLLPALRLPAMVLWGLRDPYLGAELLEHADSWAREISLHRFHDLGHFCHQEDPERVNHLLERWLARQRGVREA